MCGIVGIYQNKRIKKSELEKRVRLMNDSQERRGPDDAGLFFYLDEGRADGSGIYLALGNRRLSINDLSEAGHQPMQFRSGGGDLWVTFNGEIYNFLELREDLKKEFEFKTGTDTEIILALYAKYKEASFSKLRGMFAFALWDGKAKRFFLVKDRYGIKPLYYAKSNDKLIFSSTVEAIEKSGLIQKNKDPKALISFLLFGSVALPSTTVKNIFGLPAGHYLVKEEDEAPKIVRYYDPLLFFLNKEKVDAQRAAYQVRKLLEEAVQIHLISDAPLGVFLSGGIDSSSLAVLSALESNRPITTLSISFAEEQFSEKRYQDLVARKIKSDHREINLKSKDLRDSFGKIFEAMDQPTVDGVNTFFISKAAKEAGLKAVLSGLGGDEIFYGYPSFRRASFIRKFQKLPKLFKFPLGLFSALGDRYGKLSYFFKKDILSFYLGIRGLFTPLEVSAILDIDLREINRFLNEVLAEQALDASLDRLNPVDLLSYLELKFYLQNQLLKDTDFMSMYHSIEARVPFLDHPLVEYLSGLSPDLKIKGGVSKPLLVDAVRDLVPQQILSRAKMGFTFPFAPWLRENFENPVIQRLNSKNLVTNNLKDKFKTGRLHWSRFWALCVLGNLDW